MIGALYSGESAPGSSPGRRHCVVFLGKTLYCRTMDEHPIQGGGGGGIEIFLPASCY